MNTQSLEKVMELGEGRQRELAAYAEELIKEFPEITLRSWAPSYRLKDGQWQAGVKLNLTGPEVAVEAFLASLGLARNLDRIQIIQGIDPETGRTFDNPVKDFTAYLTLWKMD
jgi:hypothetical protein